MTDGRTQLVGLIGWPVEHSLSPAMHNAAFRSLGLNWRYVPLPVTPGHVGAAVKGLSALGFRGANVTVPHKQAVIEHLDSLSSRAQALGAVNTLTISRTKSGAATLRGCNTDVAGFLGTLRDAGLEPSLIERAVVAGAGGAARAAVYALATSGTRQILVLNRNARRAENLVTDLAQIGQDSTKITAAGLIPEVLIDACDNATVLINATSAGMWPNDAVSIWPAAVKVPPELTVMDMVYAPLDTRLLRQARRSGARTIDGLGMLVLQGALAFSEWTRTVTVNDVAPLMRTACESVLVPRL